MKKTIVAIVIAIILGIGIYYYRFVSDYSYLANTKGNITSIESNGSEGTFHANKGEKIKVSCNSSIKQGNLNIALTDSSGKVIKKFETNKDYSEQVCLDNEGEYKLSVAYDNFIGNFNVKCK